jgi:predicted porin
MKKSLIALAVASAVAAPAAFAATSNVDVYGIISASVDLANTDDENTSSPTTPSDESDLVTGRDNVSRIGFKGSEDLGGGLSAVWQIESQLNSGSLAGRNTFVGLKSSSLGTVLLGRHDTPYKMATGKLDPFADTAADYNAIIGASSTTSAGSLFDLRPSETVIYTSPSMSGFTVAAAYSQSKVNETQGHNDDTSGWSLSGVYSNGPLFASLAYEKHDGSFGAFQSSSVVSPAPVSADSIRGWKVGLGYVFGNTQLGGVYENLSGGDSNGAVAGGEANNRKAYYLSAVHNMGNIALKGAYGHAGDSDALATGNDDGAKFYAVGADYMLSKRTTVFGLYTKLSNNNATALTTDGGGYDLTPYSTAALGNDPSVFSIGVKHAF